MIFKCFFIRLGSASVYYPQHQQMNALTGIDISDVSIVPQILSK